ncbi:hypothetical protein EI94DRAFT_366065 [Lactarius quietus]|nr:hypothetical protein EI94DRAFT_366065 [Lactarius quietus]
MIWWHKLRAAAGPNPDPKDDDSEPEATLISIPTVPKYRDPLHVILEYIAEESPNCDMAIVHDDDLALLDVLGDGATLEAFQPDVVLSCLRSSKLAIHEVELGPDPSTGDKVERANANTQIVRVCSLSTTFEGQFSRISESESGMISMLSLQSSLATSELFPTGTMPFPSTSTLTEVPSTFASSRNYGTIFTAALIEYHKQTKCDITSHPLTAQLYSCDSPGAIISVLRTQVQSFDQSQSAVEMLTKWLVPTVRVLYACSAILGNSDGLIFPPSIAIFAGIGVLLQAINDEHGRQDALIDVFGRIEHSFQRLVAYIGVQPTAAMKGIITNIMVEVLLILGIVTDEIGQGRTKKFFKKLVGKKNVEDALQRLDKMTQEVAQIAEIEVLRVTPSLRNDSEMKLVDDKSAKPLHESPQVEGVVAYRSLVALISRARRLLHNRRKPTAMEAFQELIEKAEERKERDVRAVRWLVDNTTMNAEMEPLVMAIPGTFNTEWGRDVWMKVSDERWSDRDTLEPQTDRPSAGGPASLIHPSSHPLEGTAGDTICRSVRSLFETCENHSNFENEDARRRRMRACVEAMASLVCVIDFQLDWFGEVGKLVSEIGHIEQINQSMTTTSDFSFIVRWTCLSLVTVQQTLPSSRLQVLADYAVSGLARYQSEYGQAYEAAWRSAQKIEECLKIAWERAEELRRAFEPWTQKKTREQVEDILRNHEQQISDLERLKVDADAMEDVDWRISLYQDAQDEDTYRLTRQLPGVAFDERRRSETSSISDTFITPSTGSAPVTPQLIFPGQQVQALARLGSKLREVLDGKDDDGHKEALESLKSVDQVPVSLRRPSEHTTLRQHATALHTHCYRKWCELNHFDSMLPEDAKLCKSIALEKG